MNYKMYHITVFKNDVTVFSTQDYIEEHANKILYTLTDALDDSYTIKKVPSYTYNEMNIDAYIKAIEGEYNI